MQRFVIAGLLILVVAAAQPVRAAEPDGGRVDFNRDIRPILSDVCFNCHGPDKNQRKADLRLDVKDDVYKDRGGYKLAVAGKLDESELYSRLVDTDPKQRMPPLEALRQLTKTEIDLFKRWIEQGAEWQGHWAYIKPDRPTIPALEDEKRDGPPFVRNAIDRFVLQKLREKGLAPAPEADRVTLIRRLSFDLLGLPPTSQEVQAFVDDRRDDAYEQLVDRLLGSPHFGERMAMYWLDLVRYADTNGYHGDNHEDRDMYRDWVINAFNDNMPFDRFTVEQLAGDLLPDANTVNRVASGYNRLLMTTREGGAQAKEYMAKYSADRVRNFSSVWMAGTVGCAECHDHKYDPYTTRDFYSLAAFFADIQEIPVGEQPGTKIPTAEQAAALARIDAEIAPLRKILDAQTPELDAAQVAWEQSLREKKIDWTVLKPAAAVSKQGAMLKVLEDGTILAEGANPATDQYDLKFAAPLKGVTALRLEVLPDDSFPAKGPGRAGNGNFVLNEFDVKAGDDELEWSAVTASHSQADWPVANSVDGKPETGWAILPQAGQANEAVFQTNADAGDGAPEFTVAMQFNFGGSHTIGKFWLSVTSSPRPVRAGSDKGLPKNIGEIFVVDAAQRSDKQKQELSAYFRTIAPQLAETRTKAAALQKQRDGLFGGVRTTLVSTSGAPRMMRVLPRGNWLDESGDAVAPGAPAFMNPRQTPPESGRLTRVDLANWVVSPENPLTARVFVNRLWKIAFGQGLVKSMEDFGSQGVPPTHPHLLDWLAREFIEPPGAASPPLSKGGSGGSGEPVTAGENPGGATPPNPPLLRGGSTPWDVKRLLRLMVTSGTYRQLSHANEALRQRDPYNQWLARQNRYRLDAELVRDNALAVSGLLVHKLGGPSARPYQPPLYWSYLNFPVREYQNDTGDGLYRRGLYTYWCRTFLHPSLKAFDAPTREECTAERPRSNTPLQALVLLNDPTYVEAARAFAERIVRDGGAETASRLNFAYQQSLSRPVRPKEAELLTALLAKHLENYKADPKSADELLHVGARPLPAGLDAPELAAWTSVARVIFNLHETMTRD
ncbi:MAG: PSD1 domain-containing protein [Planctomycetia bacterium]|nr:PSD1 domain-containing protein [Planctomycetia bacterium]